jgi:general secretion pathway protein H
MPTSVPGNPEGSAHHPTAIGRFASKAGGFTLLELLVVLAVMGLATGGVVMALRDSSDQLLEREAQRLAATWTAAQAQARVQGTAVSWQAQAGGYRLGERFEPWLQAGTVARVLQPAQTPDTPANSLLLGPEPLAAPATVALSLQGKTLWLQTDGLRPFRVTTPAAQSAP